jgi:hypothetical protein
MFNTGMAVGYGSSIGLGAKADKASINDGVESGNWTASFRANGSGGVGRSPMAYFLS